jgi:hypothetical protein
MTKARTLRRFSLAAEFSAYPAGRFQSDGPFSGEAFRNILAKMLTEFSSVEVDLDDTLGYGSSFLEEAFGGLIRVSGYTYETLKPILSFKSSDKLLVKEIDGYMLDAERVRTKK